MNESRHFSRIPFHADVHLRFHSGSEMKTLHLLDISLKGALVKSDQPGDTSFNGEGCSMALNLGRDGESIVMEGKIIHHEGQLIGIKCQYIDLDSMTNLRRLVELNIGDEKQVERELCEMLKTAADEYTPEL